MIEKITNLFKPKYEALSTKECDAEINRLRTEMERLRQMEVATAEKAESQQTVVDSLEYGTEIDGDKEAGKQLPAARKLSEELNRELARIRKIKGTVETNIEAVQARRPKAFVEEQLQVFTREWSLVVKICRDKIFPALEQIEAGLDEAEAHAEAANHAAQLAHRSPTAMRDLAWEIYEAAKIPFWRRYPRILTRPGRKSAGEVLARIEAALERVPKIEAVKTHGTHPISAEQMAMNE